MDAFHIIHHELAHIHDNNKKIDIFKEQMKSSFYSGKSSILYPIAELCWSEYIANFISSKSAINTQYPHLVMNNFIFKLEEFKTNFDTQLLAYNINRDNSNIFSEIIKQIESLFKSASSLIGYLNGMNICLQELNLKNSYEIESSSFYKYFEALKYELSSMHMVYPDGFINLNIYRKLSQLLESFFSNKAVEL